MDAATAADAAGAASPTCRSLVEGTRGPVECLAANETWHAHAASVSVSGEESCRWQMQALRRCVAKPIAATTTPVAARR